MTQRPWHTGELQVLRTYAHLGAKVVGQLLERSTASVEGKARQLGVSLTVTGDDTPVPNSAALLARIREIPELNICPLCGTRFANMRNTGMCRACHLDQLIAHRETQLAELVRERKLTKLRQDKARLRICDGCGQAFYPRANSKSQRCEKCGGYEG